MANFKPCFEHVLGVEGDYSNDPDDYGGPTRWGITIHDLEVWRSQKLTADDVRHLSQDEAEAIYKKLYWDVLALDQVESQAIGLVLFDQAVHRGVTGATKTAQKITGQLIDGVFGPDTLAAVNAANADQFCWNYIKEAQDYYANRVTQDHSQIVYIRGWINRSQDLYDAVRALGI